MNVKRPMLGVLPERVRGCCVPVAPPLPTDQVDQLSGLFKALADPARLQILHILRTATAPVCVCDFTAALELGQPTISHHLARLKDAGLITSEKRGVWAFYELQRHPAPPARTVLALID